MARNVKYEEVKQEVTRQVVTETFTCDGCGQEISVDGIDGDYANDLRVYLNPNECVNHGHGRDYCTECLKPIWDAICKLIGADPDDQSKASLGDRY